MNLFRRDKASPFMEFILINALQRTIFTFTKKKKKKNFDARCVVSFWDFFFPSSTVDDEDDNDDGVSMHNLVY